MKIKSLLLLSFFYCFTLFYSIKAPVEENPQAIETISYKGNNFLLKNHFGVDERGSLLYNHWHILHGAVAERLKAPVC